MARLTASLLALLASAALAAPAQAAAPRFILVSGPQLPRPVVLRDPAENNALFSSLLDADHPSPGWETNRPRYDLALFWVVLGKPTQPAKADQHGWFYPATAGRRAVAKLLINGQDFLRVVPPSALRMFARHGIPAWVK